MFGFTFGDILNYINKKMLYSTILLYFLGLVAIYSAGCSINSQTSPYAFKQLIFGLLGAVVYYLILRIGFKSIFKLTIPFSIIVLVMLFLLMIIGHVSKGAQSWFNLGFIRLQPSEFGKIAFAMALAQLCSFMPPTDFKGLLCTFVLSIVFLLPILLQPDLGSALVYSVMIFVTLIVAGTSHKFIFSLVGGGLALLPFGWMFLKPYQRMRLLVFIDPSVDPQGAGYNVIQSRIEVGSGGFIGKGFLHGTQAKLHFLPEPHTDFIFGVFSEEFGFVGCFIVLVLFAVLLWEIVKVSKGTRDVKVRIFTIAIAGWLWFQITESIAMCMGLAPVTGLPLPLFSYGGSSLLAVIIALAMVQSIAVGSAKERF